jgi:hypothetical protein
MNWTTEKLGATDAQILRDITLSKVLNTECEFPKVNPFFRKNPCIRAPHIPFEYTPQEKINVYKIHKDPKFLSQMSGIVLRNYQEEVIDNYQKSRFNLIVNSRQTGMSQMLALEAFHFIISNTDKSVAIFANKMESATNILDRIKSLYLRLPYYAKPGVKIWNYRRVEFDNGCTIRCHTSRSVTIGYDIDFAIIDNFAHFYKGHDFCKAMFPSITLHKDSKISITSTPNGDNYFKKLVDESTMFTKQWIYWNQVPGRGDDWKKQEIYAVGGIKAFAQEYDLLFSGTKEWNRYLVLEKLIKN